LALLVTRADARDGEKSVITCKGLSAEYIEQLSLRYPVEDIYALSPAQEGMLYHALHEPSSAYFVQFSFRVYGQLDILLVEKSLEHLFRRHQVFRTVFISEGIERPLQVVLREWKKEFLYSDIRCTAQGRKEKEAAVRAFKEKDKNRSFDLRSDIPPIRIAVIQVDEEEYEFVWSNHHILMDGWCSEILYSEFFQVYLGYLENRPIHLAPVKPYRIYLEWLAEQNHDNPRAYWKDLLNGYNQTVGIPRKRDFQADTKEYIREEFSFSLAKEKITVLEQLAAKNQVTLSVLFQAIWGILLAKYNNSRDIVFGIVVSGRPGDIPGVESMVGVFINTIPVRIRLNDTTTFSKLTQQLQEQAGESEPYHYYSLAEIQAQSALKQNLIDHFLTFLNYPGGELLRKGIKEGETVGRNLDLEITHVESLERSNYNMDVLVYFIDPLTVKLRYNIAVYDSGFMKKLAQHIEEVVDQVTQDNFIRVQDIRVSHDRLAIKISVPLDDGNDFEL
jgi:iturin family lipopeptide synthetase B/iturin family lipopeptide synthetase C